MSGAGLLWLCVTGPRGPRNCGSRSPVHSRRTSLCTCGTCPATASPRRTPPTTSIWASRGTPSPFFTLVKDHADVFAQLPAAVHRCAIEAYIASASHHGLQADEMAMLADPWSDGEGQAAFYRQIDQADKEYTAVLEPLMARLQVPTHIVWGENDTWIPVDRAQRLHETIPHSTLKLVPRRDTSSSSMPQLPSPPPCDAGWTSSRWAPDPPSRQARCGWTT